MLEVLLALSLLIQSAPSLDTTAVRQLIKDRYYRTLPDSVINLPWEDLQEHLDPYTKLLNEEDQKQFTDGITGVVRGSLGIAVDSTDHGFIVTRVLEQGPAYLEGLAIGDQIVEINNEPASSYDVFVRHFVGPEDVYVRLVVRRGAMVYCARVKRMDVHKSSMFSFRSNNTAFFDIYLFSPGLSFEFIMHSAKVNSSTVDTLVIDLRGNRGGLLNECIAICDEFVDSTKPLLKMVSSKDSLTVVSTPGGMWTNLKHLVIIQDDESASASEILAGVLSTYCSVEIIGTRSYGKGMVQTRFNIKGGELILTVCEYFAAGTLKVQGVGIPASRGVRRIKRDILPSMFDVQAFRKKYPAPSLEALQEPAIKGKVGIAHLLWGDQGYVVEMLLQKVYEQ